MKTEDLYRIYLQHPEVTTDSRTCPPGGMFFALKGANFDGNKYAAAALACGCAVAVVDDAGVVPEGDRRYCIVDDVMTALQQLAAHHRKQTNIPIIQITGTNGKTTTKELLSAVLQRKYHTLSTEGNLNNHIGVPRTLLRLGQEHEIAVIETGANHPGEIAFLCGMVQATCGLITNVGRAHLEGFGSFEGVKRTKGELYDDLKRRDCPAFINQYDTDLRNMAREKDVRIIPYVEGEIISCSPFLTVGWNDGEKRHIVETRLIGSYNLPNVLSAITVGRHFGVDAEEVNRALREYVPTNNRSEFRRTERNSLIIDAYNANPTSMSAALKNFSIVEADNKMAILGDMRELGNASLTEHQKVVDLVCKMDLTEVWFVGNEFEHTDLSAMRVPYTLFCNVDEVMERLCVDKIVSRTILIKGSNGTRLYLLPDLL